MFEDVASQFLRRWWVCKYLRTALGTGICWTGLIRARGPLCRCWLAKSGETMLTGNYAARVARGNQCTWREGPRTLGVASQRKKYDLRPGHCLWQRVSLKDSVECHLHNTPVAGKTNPLSSRGLGWHRKPLPAVRHKPGSKSLDAWERLERLRELIHFIIKIMGDGNPRKAQKAIPEGPCLYPSPTNKVGLELSVTLSAHAIHRHHMYLQTIYGLPCALFKSIGSL